jgi:CRP-like cAMP-binding protein
MLSPTERIDLLRRVNIFDETPTEVLAEVADLLELVEYPAGEAIIVKDETGDCMYFIVSGKVQIHDGARLLNYLTTPDVFGETALLDAQPRSASVTAVDDTALLRLSQAEFYELMANRPEFSRGVIRVLSRHMRERVHEMTQDFAYMQRMERVIEAATALEAGKYDAQSLEEVAQGGDALGHLARVFQKMASEVVARETRLKQEVVELRIEIDEVRKTRDLTEITKSTFFKELQDKAKLMRKKDDTQEPPKTPPNLGT